MYRRKTIPIMTNAPTPTAIPAIAPGLKADFSLSEFVFEGGDIGGVSFDETLAVVPKEILSNDARPDAYKLGKLDRSVDSHHTANGGAIMVPDVNSVVRFRVVEFGQTALPSDSTQNLSTTSMADMVTTVLFWFSKVVVKFVSAVMGNVILCSQRFFPETSVIELWRYVSRSRVEKRFVVGTN